MNIYQARQRNAVRWAKAINKVLDAGGIVLDGDRKVGRFQIRENGDVVESHGQNCCLLWFLNQNNLDNGMFTTISDFDKQFLNFKFIHPKHVKRLKKHIS